MRGHAALDMGVEPFLLASSLIGVGAQRLVPPAVPGMPQAFAADAAQLRALGLAPTDGTLYSAQGCAACNRSAIAAAPAIYELLTVDDDLRRLIHDRAAEHVLRRMSFPAACVHCAMTACLGRPGVISLEEVVRVTANSRGGPNKR